MFSISKRIVFCFCLIAISAGTKAQQFYDHFVAPDSLNQAKVYESVSVLNLFTVDNPDSLYHILGNDSSIVKSDTLKKYASLHAQQYDYPKSNNKNPKKWSIVPGSFYLERTYVGPGKFEGKAIVYSDALVMTTQLSQSNGKIVITNISFKIVPVTQEMNDAFLKLRGTPVMDEAAIKKAMEENAPKPNIPGPQPTVPKPEPPKFDPPPHYDPPRYTPPPPRF